MIADQRRKPKYPVPDEIPYLQRVRTIKIFGVTFTSSLSITLHVQSVITSCVQTFIMHCKFYVSMDHATAYCRLFFMQSRPLYENHT